MMSGVLQPFQMWTMRTKVLTKSYGGEARIATDFVFDTEECNLSVQSVYHAFDQNVCHTNADALHLPMQFASETSLQQMRFKHKPAMLQICRHC